MCAVPVFIREVNMGVADPALGNDEEALKWKAAAERAKRTATWTKKQKRDLSPKEVAKVPFVQAPQSKIYAVAWAESGMPS